MKKFTSTFLLLLTTSSVTYSATPHVIWGASSTALPPVVQSKMLIQRATSKSINQPTQNFYQLKPVSDATNPSKHTRYQLLFRGIPVWGYQLVMHKKPDGQSQVTGTSITGIETDIPDVEGKLTKAQAIEKIQAELSGVVAFKVAKKVIYIDEQQKAHLAYHVAFYLHGENTPIQALNYLVDAHDGSVLKQWDNAHHEKIGQGMGGNTLPLPYRAGAFQYGDALSGIPSLGKFDVEIKEGVCSVENNEVKVMSLNNAILAMDTFPISASQEQAQQLAAYSYPCSADSQYIHYADSDTGTTHYAYSPVNDTMFFAQKTIDLYKELYGVKQPLGNDLPLRAYTHLGAMDNAFAYGTIFDEDGKILAHQQIGIGNGEDMLSAPSQSVVAHELSHNFTEFNSGLIYDGQPGGINEAFSDMAAIALNDYLRSRYPWYWDGKDWTIGRESMLTGEPLRYMDDPAHDGRSINHAKDYHDYLDVHYSSGVFNRAFYLLANQPGWSIQKAFQVMVDANQNYWQPNSQFDFAACGVIQAALDKGWDKTAVEQAFAEVGVYCHEMMGSA